MKIDDSTVASPLAGSCLEIVPANRKAGLGKRINMIMQTVFFKLSGRLRCMSHRCGIVWRSASCSPLA